ncbi:MAG: hypothetical protein ACI4PX_05770, partial [Ruminococcus sp.]
MDIFKILFLIAVIITVVSSSVIIKNTKKPEPLLPDNPDSIDEDEDEEENKPPEPPKNKKLISFLPFNAGTVSLFAGIIMNIILGMIDTEFKNAFILMAVTLVFEYIFMCFYHTYGKKLLKFCTKTLAVLSVLEITVFNFPSYHIWFGDYQQKTLDFSECSVEVGEADIDTESDTVH